MLRLDQRQVRHAFSYAGQQASGIGYWTRDPEHIEKSFDFGGMGARNGVMASTMVALGASGIEDPFAGDEKIFSTLADNRPQRTRRRTRHALRCIQRHNQKWSVGSPPRSVLDSVTVLLDDPAVATRITHAHRDSAESLATTARFPSVPPAYGRADDRGRRDFCDAHDVERMRDEGARRPHWWKSYRAKATRLATASGIVGIETADGRSHRTYAVRGTALQPDGGEGGRGQGTRLMVPFSTPPTNEVIVAGQSRRFGPVSGLRRLLQA
jgi:hypothetical protein